jgi:hypothetical protein
MRPLPPLPPPRPLPSVEFDVSVCECKSVRLIVDVPLEMGAVGDTDEPDGNSGVVSDLSSYGRLKQKKIRLEFQRKEEKTTYFFVR